MSIMCEPAVAAAHILAAVRLGNITGIEMELESADRVCQSGEPLSTFEAECTELLRAVAEEMRRSRLGAEAHLSLLEHLAHVQHAERSAQQHEDLV